MNLDENTMCDQDSEFVVTGNGPKKSFVQSIKFPALLLIAHFVFGYIQTPVLVVSQGLQEGSPVGALKAGYAIGIVMIFAFPLPLLLSSLSLLMKSKRNRYSFFRILTWGMLLTLLANVFFGFVLTPVISTL